MIIALAQVGRGVGPLQMIPLCEVKADDLDTALQKLKDILDEEGIETEIHLGQWLKWKDTLFSVRNIGPPTDMKRMLKAVRTAQQRESESDQRYAAFLNMNP